MVSISSIRADLYSTIKGHIQTALTDAGLSSVKVVTAFPKDEADLPVVVLPMQNVNPTRATMQDGSFTGTYRISAGLDVYTTNEEGEGPAKVAAVLDAIQDYYETTTLTENLLYETMSSNNIVRFEHNQHTLYNAGGLFNFTLTR